MPSHRRSVFSLSLPFSLAFLFIIFITPADAASIEFRQGLSPYGNTYDTYVNQGSPTTNYFSSTMLQAGGIPETIVFK